MHAMLPAGEIGIRERGPRLLGLLVSGLVVVGGCTSPDETCAEAEARLESSGCTGDDLVRVLDGWVCHHTGAATDEEREACGRCFLDELSADPSLACDVQNACNASCYCLPSTLCSATDGGP